MIHYKYPFPFTCPTSWAEITFGQFIAGCTGNPEPEQVISVLCNLTPNQVERLTAFEMDGLIETLEFTTDRTELNLLPVPSGDVGQDSYQQLLLALDFFAAYPDNEWQAAPMVYALYRHPQIFKFFDLDRIKDMAEASKARPVEEIYPYAAFFFSRLERYLMNIPIWGKPNRPETMRSIVSSSVASDGCRLWILSQMAMCSAIPQSWNNPPERYSESSC